MNTKDNKTRKFSILLALVLIVTSVMQYMPLKVMAEGSASGVVSGMSSWLDGEDVVLSWSYNGNATVEGTILRYEMSLSDGNGTVETDSNTDVAPLKATYTVTNGRKVGETYSVNVDAIYETDDEPGVEKRVSVGTGSTTWTPVYNVTFSAGANGMISYDGTEHSSHSVQVTAGNSNTFEIVPNQGYYVNTFAPPAGVNVVSDNVYSLSGISDDTNISVSFYRKLLVPTSDPVLATDKAQATVVTAGTAIKLNTVEQGGVQIQYQFVNADTEEIVPGAWQNYTIGTTVELNTEYNIGVLKAKLSPDGMTGDVTESDIVTWYYTSVPEMNHNLGYVLKDNGEEKSLTANNWMSGGTICLAGLAEDPNVAAGSYSYMLVMKNSDGAVVQTEELVWSGSENAYVYEIPDNLADGVYTLGYTVKNANGSSAEVITTSAVLALDRTVPLLVWDASDSLVQSVASSTAYYANDAVTITFDTSSLPVSGIAAYQYKIADGEWQTAMGNSITIPLTDISVATNVALKIVSNSGLETEDSFTVTKDVTPPGGIDGSIAEELISVTTAPVLDNKNPADPNVTSVDTSTENTIYYDPNNANTPLKFEFGEISAQETESNSKIYFKYKVLDFGTAWSRDSAYTLAPLGDGTYAILVSDVAELTAEGKHVLYVWTEDEVGNYSEPVSYVMCYDNTKPVITNQTNIQNSFEHGSFVKGDELFNNFASPGTSIGFQLEESGAGISKIEYYNIANGETLIYTDKSYENRQFTSPQSVSYALNTQGEYVLMVRVYDMAGNYQEARWNDDKFILDATAPVLNVNLGGVENKWTNSSVNVTISASDTDTGIRSISYSVNGQEYTENGNGRDSVSLSLTVSDEALDSSGYPLTVTVINNAGMTTTYGANIRIDKKAPVISLGGVTAQQKYSGSASVSVSVKEEMFETATGSISAQRTIDGVTTNHLTENFALSGKDSSRSFSFTADGEYQVTAEARDGAGNSSGTQSISFRVDSTAPIISLTGVENGQYYNTNPAMRVQVIESFYEDTDVTIKVIKSNDGLTTEYMLPQMVLSAKASVKEYVFDQEGTYVIEVNATDAAGNVATTQTVSFNVDKTAPNVTIIGFNDHVITDSAVNAVFGITESYYQGLRVKASVIKTDMEGKTTEIELDYGTVNSRNSQLTQEFTEDGQYTLLLEATDIAGNTSSATKDFTIDTQAPVINYLDEYDGKYFPSFSLQHSMEEMLFDFTLSEYDIVLNGMAYDGVSEITEEGKYLLEITVKDEAGHETSGKAEFIVDNTAPMIIFAGAEDNVISYEPIALDILLKDTQDSITEITINGQKQEIAQAEKQTLAFNEYGTYEVQVTAEDYAGNREVTVFTAIYKEKTIFMKWFENKPLFFGSIAGGAVAAGTSVFLLARKRKLKIK